MFSTILLSYKISDFMKHGVNFIYIQRANITLAIRYTTERSKFIDYTYPHMIDTICFTSPLPRIQYFVNLFQPFDTYVWVLTTITTIGLMFVFNHQFKGRGYWIIFSMDKLKLTKSPITLKILIAFWFIFLNILSVSYGGVLHSLITIPHTYSIDTIDALLIAHKQGKMSIYSLDASAYNELVKVCIY